MNREAQKAMSLCDAILPQLKLQAMIDKVRGVTVCVVVVAVKAAKGMFGRVCALCLRPP